jgi:hypothetical protein
VAQSACSSESARQRPQQPQRRSDRGLGRRSCQLAPWTTTAWMSMELTWSEEVLGGPKRILGESHGTLPPLPPSSMLRRGPLAHFVSHVSPPTLGTLMVSVCLFHFFCALAGSRRKQLNIEIWCSGGSYRNYAGTATKQVSSPLGKETKKSSRGDTDKRRRSRS